MAACSAISNGIPGRRRWKRDPRCAAGPAGIAATSARVAVCSRSPGRCRSMRRTWAPTSWAPVLAPTDTIVRVDPR